MLQNHSALYHLIRTYFGVAWSVMSKTTDFCSYSHGFVRGICADDYYSVAFGKSVKEVYISLIKWTMQRDTGTEGLGNRYKN